MTAETNIAKRITAKFGGARKLARLLGVTPATVYRWGYEPARGGLGGLIPVEYHQRLLDLGAQTGVDLRPEDFFARPRPSLVAEAETCAIS